MELNMVMAIVNRDRHEAMEDIIHGQKLPLAMTLYAKGTAQDEHLSLYGLVATEKALLALDLSLKLLKIKPLHLHEVVVMPALTTLPEQNMLTI